jgi:hypothetical protein
MKDTAMPTYGIELTDDEDLAFQARVVFLNEQAALDPPPFPPVTPVADVTALIASYMVSPIVSVRTWYLAQAE